MDELMKQEMKYDVSAPFSNGENFNNLYKMAQRIRKTTKENRRIACLRLIWQTGTVCLL